MKIRRQLSTLLALAMAFVLVLGAFPAMGAAADQELYSFTLLANLGAEVKEPDRIFFEELGKKLNLDIKLEIPPGSSYNERLQMMIASGEYAELTLFPNHTDKMLIDAIEEGVFIPLNQYLENSPNLMQYSYQVSWDSLKLKGDENIYGIPRTSIARADGLAIRRDWLKNVGIEYVEGEPISLEKLEEILTAFTFNDPDKNGANDTYGFGGTSADGNLNVLFGSAFGLIGWQEYDGQYMNLQYSKTHDNFKRALEFSNKLWKAGVIDPDLPTIKDGNLMKERFVKGIYGTMGEFAGWITDHENNGKAIVPTYEVTYTPAIVAAEGDKGVGGSFSLGFWGNWHIANTAEKPERIVQMLDYMLSDEFWPTIKYGPEGTTWEMKDGVITALPAYQDYTFGKATLRRNNDPAFFVSLNQTAENRARIEGLIGKCIDQAIFSLDKGFRPAVENDPIFIDYKKEMATKITKIIVGELPVSDWDAILEGWYAAGGQSYVEEMQAYIASQNKK